MPIVRSTELTPIRERPEDFERLEARIRKVFIRALYKPLLHELGLKARLENAKKSDLERALATGRVTFKDGVFTGKFDAGIVKELKAYGAKWAKGKFRLEIIPTELKILIGSSQARFSERLRRVDELIAKKLPEEIAGIVSAEDLFDSRLLYVDRKLAKGLRDLRTLPELTPEQREKIATEWNENLQLWIKDFTGEEITRLRKDVARAAFRGDRYSSLVKSIERSYGVTKAKAKFFARQETSLLMTKFKETRYTSAGINEYRWGCVAGSPAHPVRPVHKALEGRVFTWQDPPITTPPGEPARRNNPGQDFNCRCFAKPIVRF